MTEIRVDHEEAARRIDEVRQRLRGALSDPIGRGLMDCGHYVMRLAIRNAPVDTGVLRASIIASPPEVDASGEYAEVTVGTDVAYARAMEFGTRPFWPPPGALAVWARRHGVSEFVVRRAIARRGIRPRRYLQRAFLESQEYIRRRMTRAIREATQR